MKVTPQRITNICSDARPEHVFKMGTLNRNVNIPKNINIQQHIIFDNFFNLMKTLIILLGKTVLQISSEDQRKREQMEI